MSAPADRGAPPRPGRERPLGASGPRLAGALLLLLAAACAPREGSVSGAYVGGAAGANLRPGAPAR